MSEIRSVSVHLDADVAGYLAKMRLVESATNKAFGGFEHSVTVTNSSLKSTDGTLGKVSTDVRRLGNDVDNTRLKVDTGAKSIDRYSGRLGLILDRKSVV